jgi:excisionase family DNA binding protein
MVKIGDVEVLTLAEAAERLGVKRNTLVQQVRKGALAATLSGHTYLVTADEVERYRAEHRGKRGSFQNPNHPLHGKQGPGHRRKARKNPDE